MAWSWGSCCSATPSWIWNTGSRSSTASSSPVTQLRRAIHKVHKVAGQPRLGSIYNERATDKSKGVFRLDAVKVVIAELDKQERDQLRGELTELIKALDGAE